MAGPFEGDGWRTNNAGRLLVTSADAFARDKLRTVAAAGFGGVTQGHMALVQNLDLGGTRLTSIATRARMTKQSMLELVDKVEALGLVERRPDPADGRAKIVAFTPAGRRMLGQLRQGVALAERRMADTVGAGFVAEMKRALSAYVAGAEGDEVAGPEMSGGDTGWRLHNAGRVLVSAFGVFNRDVLRQLRGAGFVDLAEIHLTLVRNLELRGMRLTDVAARANMTKQAMAELVAKTEALGLVARAPDPHDRRAKTIVFTPGGHRLLGEVRRSVEAAEGRLAQATDNAFLATLRAQLVGYVAAVGGRAGPAAHCPAVSGWPA